MPTYVVRFYKLKISNKQKAKIAQVITNVHSKTTGANRFFAQVIFEQTNKNNHYMGGKSVKTKEIFVNGQIRSGRPTHIKKNLILGLRNGLEKVLDFKKENIWIYIEDLIPEQMIEYGEILPKSGKEKIWFNKLSTNLKRKLKKLE